MSQTVKYPFETSQRSTVLAQGVMHLNVEEENVCRGDDCRRAGCINWIKVSSLHLLFNFVCSLLIISQSPSNLTSSGMFRSFLFWDLFAVVGLR